METTMRIQQGKLRLTCYPEGGRLLETHVQGIGWVVADELNPTPEMQAAAAAPDLLAALDDLLHACAGYEPIQAWHETAAALRALAKARGEAQ